ncbi:MAG TPA: enoyl-CoA hydratase/isomerase family protein [Gordonia sp. (in: high G+C Gram-positive bacteria)]|uniref:enoyl-CoA hydratase/isomerase family protein n=1 Tax=unclassified Gordonia (in: high G+C Gram-positive bacteria) TaxID=2657482 RepID=UPI000FB2A57B|nr:MULTISPECIES: enoyl-CoA hydratase/isomerase family protein [unclassified Gordonia (in: high G+C Gram-positive bacteria)]RUP37081.1 MAG: enoyl-CoA hydratase/isomerase family protein [Gordonia sp. (in: high G+C Gram-positive bacteria)]HNP55445.1 enoyl-CoA hydratase/isomerase family protein [Gordonia sp. (in: high G+C Gram-positive bacteria)]HRC50138.1 enoyl-CoA hydratase/isomerase family protein [Gordonia sp. (in: high G+C Gram-positive bacteria)]
MPFLRESDDVYELYLGTEGVELDEANPENRFNLGWIDTVNALLDEVATAGSSSKKGLVITATGKFFSNGLDTDYVFANGDKLPGYLDSVHDIYTKVLTLPVATVAAVNGHAFGAGAMLALCADYRIQRADRGFWSLPEAALNMPFTAGMAALVRTRLTDAAATEAMLTSRRYGADDAAAAGIVEEPVPADDLLARARAVAAERAAAGAGANLAIIKRGLRAPLLEQLAITTPTSLL